MLYNYTLSIVRNVFEFKIVTAFEIINLIPSFFETMSKHLQEMHLKTVTQTNFIRQAK